MNDVINGTAEDVCHATIDTKEAISPFAALLGSHSGEQPEYEYDAEGDIATISRKDHAPIVATDDTVPGVVVDMDEEGQVVAVEILDFAKIVHSLGFISIEIAKSALVMRARNAIEGIVLEESDIFTK